MKKILVIRQCVRREAVLLLMLWFVFAPSAAFASAEAWAGKVTHLSGTLVARKADGGMRLLAVQSSVFQGDLLSTEAGTYARVKFADDAEMVLRPNSQLKVESYHFDQAAPEKDSAILRLLKGGLRAVTGLLGQRSKDRLEYRTATATIGIRGTNLGAQLCADDCADIPTVTGEPPANGLYVDVASGGAFVRNEQGSQDIGPGEFAYVASPQDVPRLVPAANGLQVTMPQSISSNLTEGRSVGGAVRDTQCGF